MVSEGGKGGREREREGGRGRKMGWREGEGGKGWRGREVGDGNDKDGPVAMVTPPLQQVCQEEGSVQIWMS